MFEEHTANFLDPIAKVWSHSSILGISGIRKKKKVSLRVRKAKKRKTAI
ncbi:MAG: hypothetical protein WCY05_06200 [Candidatus Omnitrophota bacterium]